MYSVGQAAVHPPALVVLSHIVPNSGESIAWVGKGIVYDSGGLSIKSKVNNCLIQILYVHDLKVNSNLALFNRYLNYFSYN